MARELFRTPIWRLDKFIEDQLLPDTTFLTELRADIDSISAFLKERCFQGATHPVRVSRVVMVSPISLSSLGWGGRGLSEARLQSLVGCELPTCSVPSVLMCIPAMAQGLSPVPQGDPEPSIILQRCQFHSSGLNRIPLHMGKLYSLLVTLGDGLLLCSSSGLPSTALLILSYSHFCLLGRLL